MKKFLSLSIFIMLFTFAHAQKPELTFQSTVHDFGTIDEDGGLATTEFVFTNEGVAPLVLTGVSASCGCTTPEWTKEPVPAKGKGSIKVSYNPKNRPGMFTKTITVRSNASEEPVRLTIKGEVIRQQPQN